MTDDLGRLFEQVRAFGWNDDKRAFNLRRHEIDFDDARGILSGETFIQRSDRHGESRYQVFGYLKGREVTFVCAIRGPICWIISARRASRAERRRYYHRPAGQPQPRQD